ncbi:hypothetical protein [Flagellimonas onchidii]|uniref:hypothetical protein n=1 Tax=Flagellimonas onchidii TaxID=2562684 RepID=UPI0010A64F10|nr:hypothetical protein [Allomuricauda onchidii]
MERIQIRSTNFTVKEIESLIESMKETNYDWIATVDYIASSDQENADVTFTLDEKDLGEFLSVIHFGGYYYCLNH